MQKRAHHEKQPNYCREMLLGFTVVFFVSLFMALVGYFGLLAGVEGRIQDYLWLRNASETGSREIVVLAIDDGAFSTFFGGSSPLNPAVLTDLVTKILAVNPAILGVDVRTNPPDAKLYREFANRTINSDVVWVSNYGEPHSEMANFFEWLSGKPDELVVRPEPVLGIAPDKLNGKRNLLWGPAIFPVQGDSKIRRFPRRVFLATDPASDEANEIHHSWARVIAEQYCARTSFPCKLLRGDEFYMSFGTDAPAPHSISEFFTFINNSVGITNEACDRLQGLIGGKIVLLGGTFSNSGDYHGTPRGQIAGVLVNARAVAGEITGVALKEIPQPWSFLLDLLTGFVVVLFMTGLKRWRRWEPRTARLMMLTSGAIAAIIISIMLQSHYIFSPAAVLVAALIQQLYEFWYKNPAIPEHPESQHTSQPHRPRWRRE